MVISSNIKKNIFIIIPVHNRKPITLNCLATLQTNGDLDAYQVVVIDDGSTDGTEDAIRNLYPSVILLKGDGNLWWTGAIKMGMEYAYENGAEYIIWLNDDCQPPSGMIKELLNFVISYPNSIIGGQGMDQNPPHNILFGGKRKTWQGYRFLKAPDNSILPCDLLSGNIVCFPCSLIPKIGYPDTQITPHYGGDSLYLIRAKNAGYTLYVHGRHTIFDEPSTSPLYPQHWLLGAGKPLELVQLALNPQSGLSWRVWLAINWESYHYWGIIMFLKKYTSLILITLIRFIPLNLRKKRLSGDHA